jgi:hypothetical protein
LLDSGGTNSDLNNTAFEGGAKNGVLTAIEDYLKESKHKYFFLIVHLEYGLAVIFKKSRIGSWILFLKWFLLFRFYEFNKFIQKIGNILGGKH